MLKNFIGNPKHKYPQVNWSSPLKTWNPFLIFISLLRKIVFKRTRWSGLPFVGPVRVRPWDIPLQFTLSIRGTQEAITVLSVAQCKLLASGDKWVPFLAHSPLILTTSSCFFPLFYPFFAYLRPRFLFLFLLPFNVVLSFSFFLSLSSDARSREAPKIDFCWATIVCLSFYHIKENIWSQYSQLNATWNFSFSDTSSLHVWDQALFHFD